VQEVSEKEARTKEVEEKSRETVEVLDHGNRIAY
jgi:hypothetical protein